MKLEGIVYCSGPECDSHQRVGSDTMALGKLPPGWVVVSEFGNNGIVEEEAFCSADCALKLLARVEPLEIIPFGSGEDGEG